MSKKILIAGLINIETTLKIERFPLVYNPVNYPFFGVNSTVSGVGYNLTKALTTLGHRVNFFSMLGDDLAAGQVRQALANIGVSDHNVIQAGAHTAQSVIIYEASGRRQIHTDLKDIQEKTYPIERFDAAATQADLLTLCNINFSRPFLARGRKLNKLIATDVHTLSNLDDEYNADYMKAAHILFMSDEALPTTPEAWAKQIFNRYPTEILGIGLGKEGVLLAVRADNFIERIPAVTVRPVINTIGAGDALFSAFLHGYLTSGDPYHAMRQAVLFAGYKIGVAGAADGFLTSQALAALPQKP